MADDIRLKIDADDAGAIHLLKQLTDTMRELIQQQTRSLRASVQQRDARGRFTAAVRQENTALRAEIAEKKRLLEQQIQTDQAAIRALSARTRAVSQQTQSIVRSLQQQTAAELRAAADVSRAQQQRLSQQRSADRERARIDAERVRAIHRQTQAELLASRQALAAEAERNRLSRQRAAQEMAAARVKAESLRVEQALARERSVIEARGLAEARRVAEAQSNLERAKTERRRQAHRERMEMLRRETAAELAAARLAASQVSHSQRMQALAIRQNIAAHRAAAAASVASGRTQAAAANQATAAIRNQTAALRTAQRAQHGFRGSIATTNTAVLGHSRALRGLTAHIFTLGTAYAGFRGFKRFIDEGLKFNEVIETAQLGIASIITATSTLTDPFGRVLEGAEALDAAVAAAESQVRKLRVAGLQTASTTDELVQAYQSAVAAGIAAGLTLDEIRETAVQVVQAAGAIGLPMQQLEQEVRSILDATIDRNSRVARVLGITNEQVRLAKEQNRLADYLNERLHSFSVAGERAMETFRVMKTNLLEAFQVFSGTAAEPLFRQLVIAGQKALKQMFDFDAAEVSNLFLPIIGSLNVFFDEMGHRINLAVDRALSGARDLAKWLDENRDYVEAATDSFFDMLGNVRDVVVELAKAAGHMLSMVTGGEGVLGVFDAISGAAQILASALRLAAEGWSLLTSPQALKAGATLAVAAGLIGLAFAPAITAIIATKIAIGGLITAAVMLAAMFGRKARAARDAARAHEENARRISGELRSTRQLTTELKELEVARSRTENDAKLESLRRREATLIERLIRIHPQWEEALRRAQAEQKGLAEAVDELNRSLVEQLELESKLAEGRANAQAFVLKDTLEARKSGDLRNASEEEYAKILQKELDIMTKLRREQMLARGLADEALSLFVDRPDATIESTIPNPDAKGAANDFEQIIRAQLEMLRSAQKTLEEQLKVSLENATISYQEYFDSLEASQVELIAKEIELLQKLKAATKDLGDKAKIDAEIFKLTEDRTRDALKNAEELRKNYEKLADEISGVHVAYLKATGEHIRAAGIESEKQFREIRKRLEAEIRAVAGMLPGLAGNPAAFAAVSARLAELFEVKVEIDFLVNDAAVSAVAQQIQKSVTEIQNAVNVESLSIDLMQATGLAYQEEIADRVISMYDKQLEGLRAIREEYAATLRELNTPQAREELEKLDLQIAQVELALYQARRAAQVFRTALIDATRQGIEVLLTSGLMEAFDTLYRRQEEAQRQIEETAQAIDEALEQAGVGVQERTEAMVEFMRSARSELRETVTVLDVLKEAFRSFAHGVVQALQQVIAQMIAMKAIAATLRLFDGGTSAVASGSFTPNVVAQPAFASGGYIRGPGTSTSDSIVARLSDGEYVVSASAVKRVGVATLDEINFGRSRPVSRTRTGYALGGIVQSPVSVSGQQEPMDSSLTVGLEEGLVLKHLKTPAGQKLLVQTVAANRNAMRRALGV